MLKKSQTGKLILWVSLALEILAIVTFVVSPVPKWFIALAGIPVIIALLFYKLDIFIDDHAIKISFGIGVIRKTFSRDRIANVRSVTNPKSAGWGIHMEPAFVLYNVAGREAVELSFKDQKRKVRIGTDAPKEIIQFMQNKPVG